MQNSFFWKIRILAPVPQRMKKGLPSAAAVLCIPRILDLLFLFLLGEKHRDLIQVPDIVHILLNRAVGREFSGVRDI